MSALLRYFLLCLIAIELAMAQVSTGTITGAVRDSTGAAVQGAKVTIVQTATSESRVSVTNERGEFNAPNLHIGQYSVTVTMDGFKTDIHNEVVLEIDKVLNLPIVLQPGVVTESVEVTGGAPLVDTATSSLGQVIDNKKINDLPLNGRNVWALGLLSGNSVPVKGINSNLPFTAGGGRYQSNDILLDGIDNNTIATGGNIGYNGINFSPSVDAVAEFKVKTNNYSAEYGRSAGSIVSAITKSGTNALHGDLWEFLRNQNLDANNFFSNAAGTSRQPYKQNQFGFTVGGPVLIPKIYKGRNKTFFFADYEGVRRRTSASSTIEDIPPVPFRTGDFSSYQYTIYDPRSRALNSNGLVVSSPFANNKIPTSLLNPGALATLGLLPTPNYGAPGAQAANYLFIARQPFNNDQYDIRIDHQFSDKNTLFARVSRAVQSSTNPGSFSGFLGGGTNNINNSVNTILNDVHIFTPSLVNEARFGYTRHNGSLQVLDAQGGVDFANKNGIALYPFPVQTFPQILFSYSGSSTGGSQQFNALGSGGPNLNVENLFEGADDLSWTKGKHSLKMGVDVRRDRFDVIFGGGATVYGSIFTSSSNSSNSGAPLADFLLGYPAQLTGTQLLDWARMRNLYTGTYIQDDWKISSKLTVNLGLRYELYTQPVDARDRGALFDARTGQFAVPGQNGFSRAIVDGFHRNFAPRVGFAYSPTNRWTIRGGSGVFYGPREANQSASVFGANPPNAPTVISPSVSATGTVTPPINSGSPIQVGPTSPTLSTFTAANPLGLLIRTADFANSRPAQVYQWNLGIQYQAAKNLVLEAAYSGMRGTYLTSRVNLNQIPFATALAGGNLQANRLFPNVGNQVVMDSSTGNSSYNALNLRAEKRMGAGFNFLANYTWSKNLESNGSGGNTSFTQSGGTTNPLDSWNLQKEKSYAPLNVPQVFVGSAGYELPFGVGKHFLSQRGVASAILGGWQLNGIVTLEDGFPTDIRSSLIPATNQLFATFNVPNAVSGVSMYLPNAGPNGYFNPAAFSQPGQVLNVNGTPITLFGNLARRAARGPATKNLDFSVFRNFSIHERFNLQFRAESFNFTNTPAFFLPSANSPVLTIGNPSFGKLNSSNSTGRQIQFGLKLYF
ncbi:MAG TPA: carboxypeptidase regulatory-like domain-containing protein [Bryobacteraceae bacterium]|nr:carboxypeptidase regulatory-like domain-containing protein [Bryobacteraceae bacterium]